MYRVFDGFSSALLTYEVEGTYLDHFEERLFHRFPQGQLCSIVDPQEPFRWRGRPCPRQSRDRSQLRELIRVSGL
jgi:hypothetical protein